MNNPHATQLVPIERIQKLIHLARGEKVLLDADLAKLYGVETRTLNQAVRRNLNRFPADFMFQHTREEVDILLRSRSQFVILNKRGKNIKYLPYAFTEQGVATLSSVLRSERAVQVNVAIMRAFVGLRRMLASNEVLARKLAELERRLEGDSLSASTGERIRVRCRSEISLRRHSRANDPAGGAAPRNRFSCQGRQRSLPHQKKVTMPADLAYDVLLAVRDPL